MHDLRGPFGSIISVCCEGPACTICAEEKKRNEQAVADLPQITSPSEEK